MDTLQAEQRYFLRLLAAFVNKTPVAPPPAMDAQAFFRLTEEHDLSGVAGYMLQGHPGLPDAHTAMLFSRRFYETVFLYARTKELVAAWRQKLDAAGIPHALLKGTALQALYPAPELRTYGDADIFLPHAYIPQLRALLQAEQQEITFENADEIVISVSSLLIEFHFDLTPDTGNSAPALRAYLADAAAHMQPAESENRCAFDPVFHFIYLLSHQMHHFLTGSAGIRTFVDLAVYLKSGLLTDMAAVRETLSALSMTGYAQRALALTARFLEVPSPYDTVVSDADADYAAAYILTGGQFGFLHNRGARQVEQYSDRAFPRLRALWAALFPPREQLEKDARFAALAEKHPGRARLQRILNAVFHRRRHIRDSARRIMTANETVRQRAEMQRILEMKIGGEK